jgi:hypothetical protein
LNKEILFHLGAVEIICIFYEELYPAFLVILLATGNIGGRGGV